MGRVESSRPHRRCCGPASPRHRAKKLITVNRERIERTTTGNLRPGQQLWVYGRDRRPCRRCGTPIRQGELGDSELQLRVTYWCPHCQS